MGRCRAGDLWWLVAVLAAVALLAIVFPG